MLLLGIHVKWHSPCLFDPQFGGIEAAFYDGNKLGVCLISIQNLLLLRNSKYHISSICSTTVGRIPIVSFVPLSMHIKAPLHYGNKPGVAWLKS